MPNVPPLGGQQPYTERPLRVYGEQYVAGGPLPIGAVPAIEPVYPASGGPWVNTSTGVYPLHDTDWVITNQRTGFAIEVIDDEAFINRFGGGGPPASGVQ